MPTTLKQAFKYPLLSKTIMTNDSSSMRNEFYRPDNQQNYHINNPVKTDSLSALSSMPSMPYMPSNRNIVQHQDTIDPYDNSSSEYELLDKVLKNPRCIKLLKLILNNNDGNVRNLSFNIDDITKYIVLIFIIVMIYKIMIK